VISHEPAAIVGIGCRFPGGASSPERFWTLLTEGVDAIEEVPPERFSLDGIFDPDPAREGTIYSPFGGFVDNVDRFDAAFFGFSPRQASRIDPQHRLLLEVAHEAIEDAGVSLDRLAGSQAGVFVGLSTHDYGDMQMYPANRRLIDAHSSTGIGGCIAANRISYVFDLHGPSLMVDTACSSSLTAVHLALRSLRSGECDTALVGGAQLSLAPEATIGFCKASMISPDGRSRAFAAGANGYVRGEGVAAVLLKPLAAALADKDRVYAVLLGSAVNQDGSTTGMTVPSAAAQEAMLRAGLEDAGLDAAAIQYVEAHGTGTPVGDPIEAAALGAVFGPSRGDGDRCPIGSVKTNIGHAEAAAGLAGLIKTALALQHRAIPPSLHFDEPNPEIDFDAIRLRVVTELEPWPANGSPARATVNSFGFGGANANAVLEEAPDVAEPVAEAPSTAPRLLAFSARSPEALSELARSYAALMAGTDVSGFEALCRAAARRRAHHDHRVAIVASTSAEAADALGAFVAGEPRAAIAAGKRSGHGVAFVFSGMGPQWWAMGRELVESEPVFKDALERCDTAFAAAGGWSIVETLLADEATSRMGDADVAQAANFALQVALTELLASWGIEPDGVLGHSAGEMAAAYAAGALSLDDAALVTYHRSRLQAPMAGRGKMLAVGVDEEEAQKLLAPYDGRVELAAVNAPESVTLTGDAEILGQLLAALTERQVFARMLPVEIPYHSASMDLILDELEASLAALGPQPPRVLLASPLTGELVEGPDLDAGYWRREIRHPVRFQSAVDTLLGEGCTTLLEVGPHPVLAAALGECLRAKGVSGAVLPSLRREEDARESMLQALGRLYASGRTPDWEALYPGTVEHVALPTYPWQRERHWLDSLVGDDALPAADPHEHPLLGRRVRAARPLWELAFADTRLDYLEDHAVQGTIPYPAAAYVEMGLAASRRLLGHAAPGVRDVEFRRALFLGKRAETLAQVAADPDSQRFEVHSAAAAGEPSWTLHADGTLAGGRATERQIDLAAARARCGAELRREDIYERLAGRGFEYGPAFQGLEWARVGDDEAVGEIALDVDPGPYEVHPAQLDGAIHLLILAAEALEDGAPPGAFLPVRVGEVQVHAQPGSRFFAHARVAAVGTQFAGDIDLVAPDGTVLVEVRGLECQPLEQQAEEAESPADWLYEYRWEPMPLTGAGEPSVLASARQAELDGLAAAREPLAAEVGLNAYYEEVEPLLDRAAAAYARAAFRELGWDGDTRRLGDAAGVCELLGIDDSRRPLVAALLDLVELSPPDDEPRELLRRLVEQQPTYELDARLLAICGEQVAAVLRNEADAREFLFSAETIDLLTRFYRKAPVARFHNVLVADTVAALAADANGSRPVRVLEVGGGTGGTTEPLLEQLDESAEYVFTDVSPFFTTRAAEEFGGREWFATSVFDLEREPAEQAIELGTFDVVVAANVLHATSDLEQTLRRVQGVLAPGGALVVLELTRRVRWLDAVFGLTEGWWAFADRGLRRDHALLGTGDWRALLERTGFADISALHDSPSDGVPAQSVLVARVPAEAQRAALPGVDGHWLVVEEGGGVGQRLATRLERAGASAGVVAPGELDSTPEGLDGIVDVRALELGAAVRPTAESLLDSATAACTGVVELLQTLDSAGGPPAQLVLVTGGAQEMLGSESTHGLAQSGLWGLGRSVARERTDFRCRLVDLSPEPSDEELDLLALELLAAGPEEEIAIRGTRRLVARLRRLEGAGELPARPAEPGDRFRAEVETPGLLESVRLVEVDEEPLAPGEVEIAVAAAGLNFRDVMLALDLLPTLALEELEGSDRLGLECAGTVVAVAGDVGGIAPGDEVIAVRHGAFGSHVRAREHAVFPKPPGLDFTAAAGVSVAFATAYFALVHLARLRSGERVLIHAATGGVGLAALEIARDIGAEIYATAGSPEKREFLHARGVEHVFDSRKLDFADEITERTDGRGVDVILNSLAGEAITKGISILSPSGRFVEIGKRDIYEDMRVGLLEFRKNLSYFALDLDRLLAEQPELVGDVFREVVAKIQAGAYRLPPLEVYPIGDASRALRKVAQAKHIGKVVLSIAGEDVEIVPRAEGLRFCADGTYLITGGLGGFGLALAGWLAHHGAGTLVLVGRSGAHRDSEPALDALRTAGARVEVMQADVARPEDVDRLLDRVRRELPPLRGVFHAAMVIDDAALAELDADRFRRVLEAKVAGGWNLHERTRGDSLDVFMLFSSIVSLLGNAMQANYGAANAFLDALAHHRRALGLPALAVSWGVLSDTGFVARHHGLASYMASMGLLGFDSEQAFEMLGSLLQQDVAHAMAARIDFARLAAASPTALASPRIRHLIPTASGADSQATESSDLARLLEAPPEQASALAMDFLRARIGRVLGTDGLAIEPDRPLTELGLDSLMAVELLASLKADFVIEIPVVRMLQGVTVAELVDLVLAELEPRRSATPVPGLPVDEDGGDSRPPLPPPEPALPEAAEDGRPTLPADVDGGGAESYARLDYTAWNRRQRIARRTFAGLLKLTARVDVEGLEHIPQSGAAVLAGNHLSMADVPVLFTAVDRPTIVVAATELRRAPWLRAVLSGIGNAIYVRRGEADEEAIAQALTVLRSGGMVGLAVEGRRSVTRSLERGKTGAAYLAAQAGVPVVPVAAWGQERLGRSLRRLRRAPIHVRFGKPLHLPAGKVTAAELREHTDRIMVALAQMLPDDYRGVYATAATDGSEGHSVLGTPHGSKIPI
jgi:1-acyl-sn-glycerol-3-phosphate acyltransferase